MTIIKSVFGGLPGTYCFQTVTEEILALLYNVGNGVRSASAEFATINF